MENLSSMDLCDQASSSDIARHEGWDAAVKWLRRYGDAHAGKWAGMEPREAVKLAARDMENAYKEA